MQTFNTPKDKIVNITKSSKNYILDTSITLPVDIERAFEFFKDPRNLSKITPAWLNFKMAVS